MKVKFFVGKQMNEKLITEMELGKNGGYENCKELPRKGDVILFNEETFKVSFVLHDYDYDECCVFLKKYVWGD